MQRVKIINEPAELVPMFRCVDTPLKREVFKEVCMAWKTEDEIREKYGEDGVLALRFFEKMKLVEIRWQQKEDSIEPVNAYHSFYSSFHINASWPIFEISDVLYAAIMPEEEYKKLEDKIVEMVEERGKFTGDVAEELGVSATLLKSFVKRSVRLEYRAHRIELIKDQ